MKSGTIVGSNFTVHCSRATCGPLALRTSQSRSVYTQQSSPWRAIASMTLGALSAVTKLCVITDKSGWTSTPPLNTATGSVMPRGSINIFMPSGGRPLVIVNAISVFRRCSTASMARAVNTLSWVSSVPSTSAMTRPILFLI